MSLKILHTSDWHLGKKLFKKSRIPEQQKFLEWLLLKIMDENIALLLICGDIFDTPTPPNDAISLYFNFLNEVSEKTQCQIVIIPGNHDSASFISAPLKILKKHQIHIICGIENLTQDNHLKLSIRGQVIHIKALPYFRPHELYNAINKSSSENISKKDIQKFIQDFFYVWPNESKNEFKIIMAHHAFGKFVASESEQALMLWGLESIPETWLGPNYHYMALGHIHKPQAVNKDKNIYYSGSPIPLRFSEVHNKKINLLEVENTNFKLSKIDIPIFRPIVQIKATKEDLSSKIKTTFSGFKDIDVTAYFEVLVTMDGPDNEFCDSIFTLIKDQGGELLSFIPYYTKNDIQEQQNTQIVHELSIHDLFVMYYKKKYPQANHVPDKIMQCFTQNLQEIQDEDYLIED